jgi:hypothetical protein
VESTPAKSIFDLLTDLIASKPTDQEIMDYEIPESMQARAIDLIERNGEGLLSFQEQQEMYDFMRVDQILSLWKAKIRLQKQTSGE